MTDQDEKNVALEDQKATNSAHELTVWLKDFPKSADDFKELRRSGAQHQPEIEVALQGLFMIEEDFKRDDDDEEDTVGLPDRRDSTLDHASADELEQ